MKGASNRNEKQGSSICRFQGGYRPHGQWNPPLSPSYRLHGMETFKLLDNLVSSKSKPLVCYLALHFPNVCTPHVCAVEEYFAFALMGTGNLGVEKPRANGPNHVLWNILIQWRKEARNYVRGPSMYDTCRHRNTVAGRVTTPGRDLMTINLLNKHKTTTRILQTTECYFAALPKTLTSIHTRFDSPN